MSTECRVSISYKLITLQFSLFPFFCFTPFLSVWGLAPPDSIFLDSSAHFRALVFCFWKEEPSPFEQKPLVRPLWLNPALSSFPLLLPPSHTPTVVPRARGTEAPMSLLPGAQCCPWPQPAGHLPEGHSTALPSEMSACALASSAGFTMSSWGLQLCSCFPKSFLQIVPIMSRSFSLKQRPLSTQSPCTCWRWSWAFPALSTWMITTANVGPVLKHGSHHPAGRGGSDATFGCGYRVPLWSMCMALLLSRGQPYHWSVCKGS